MRKRLIAIVLLLLVWTGDARAQLGLTVPATQPGSVNLAWDPPTPGTQVPTSYRVRYGLASGVYTQTLEADLARAVTVTGLAPSITYFFIVEAIDGAAVSPPSNELSVTMPAVGDPLCVPPLGKQAVAIFVSRLQLTGSGHAGSKAVLYFQVGSLSPVTSIEVRGNGLALEHLTGDALTPTPGMGFVIPPPGSTLSYALSVWARNAYGCTTEQKTAFSVTP